MPDLKLALVSLGDLIGVFDPTGSLQWTWFLNPLDNALNSIPDRRDHLVPLIRALRDACYDMDL